MFAKNGVVFFERILLRSDFVPPHFATSFVSVKILVVRFSSIGDIVLTSPVLRCIKNQVQGSEIHYLTKRKFFSLLEYNPHVSKIFTFESSLDAVLDQLKKENYDAVIDLHHNLRSLRVKLALGKPAFSFNKLNLRKWLYVNWKQQVMPDKHIVSRYLETVKSLGVKDDGRGLEFFSCDCDRVEQEELPPAFRDQAYAVLSIGGTHATKKMPVEKWVDLLDLIPIPAMIIGGKEDVEAGQLLENQAILNGKTVWNACGKFTIGGSAHLIRGSTLVISHDTGMMHIAAAFQKPTVAIWGNTTPELGMYPFRTKYINLEVNGLPCRPCSKIGYAQCPKGHFKCMLEQNVKSDKLRTFIQKALESSKISSYGS